MKNIEIKENIKRKIYSACALMLCCATLFAFWFSNKDNAHTENETTKNTTVESTTKKEVQVNTPVTNVKDDRYTTTTEATVTSIYYEFPLSGKIIREYSKGELTKNPTTNDWRTHNGIDISGNIGDPVKAICDGEITAIREDALWGTVVTIDHSNGIIAEYRGLQKDSVPTPGTSVEINDTIGNLGEIPIEKADGVHLHLEIYKNGTLIPPSDYLGKSVDI